MRFQAFQLGLGLVMLLSITPGMLIAQEPIEPPATAVFATSSPLSSSGLPTSVAASDVYPIETLLGNQVIGDFVLGPGKIELEVAPGESRTVEITVSNRIGEAKAFSLNVEDMMGSDDPGRSVVLLGNDVGPYTLKDYISIPATEFVLDHNLRTRIPVTVSIPPDAEPGGRYGSVLVKTVTRPAERGDVANGTTPTSAIVSRIGTLFFIRIPGEVTQSGELQNFSTQLHKKIYDTGPIDFDITYENNGSVHLNPYGEIRITNMSGVEVGFVELEPWFVLPGATRLREVSWNRDLLYGRYTATIKLNRGYDDVIDEQTVTFWVVPWQYVGACLVALFIVLFLIRSFFRTFEFKRKST